MNKLNPGTRVEVEYKKGGSWVVWYHKTGSYFNVVLNCGEARSVEEILRIILPSVLGIDPGSTSWGHASDLMQKAKEDGRASMGVVKVVEVRTSWEHGPRSHG